MQISECLFARERDPRDNFIRRGELVRVDTRSLRHYFVHIILSDTSTRVYESSIFNDPEKKRKYINQFWQWYFLKNEK